MIVRPATVEDLPTLLDFEQGIIRAERPMDETLAPDPINYYDLGELIASPHALVLVVVKTNQIIASGYAKIKEAKPYLDHDQYAYVGFMYTHPDHRGQGLAQMILDELSVWARSKNIREIRLEVYDQNESALRAYAKAGFQKNLLEMRKRI